MKFNDMERNGGGLLIGFVILLVIVGGICYYYYNSDSQSEKKDYSPIETAQELVDIGENGKYKLMCDIDISSNSWVPIEKFNGIIDGDGFSIIGMNIDNNDSTIYCGFVRNLEENGIIKNITFLDANVHSGNAGIVAGYNEGLIENVTTYGFLGKANGLSCGGIVGKNCGRIQECVNYATISGKENIGGITGLNKLYSQGGRVSECTNYGTVSGTYRDSGGIVGYNQGEIGLCTNEGSIQSKGDYVGGICGTTERSGNSVVRDSKNMGPVTGNNYVGGAIGVHCGVAENIGNEGNVTGSESVGGFIGYLSKNMKCELDIKDGYSNTVTGKQNVGGIFGHSYHTSISSYSLNGTTIIGSQYVGGIVGMLNSASVSNCDFRGEIISKGTGSDSAFGGIVGCVVGLDTFVFTDCYVKDCVNYSTIVVEGDNAGGIVGSTDYGRIYIEGCTNYGDVSTLGSYSAGILGHVVNGNIQLNYNQNEGSISGYDHVSGISNGGSGKANTNIGSITIIDH